MKKKTNDVFARERELCNLFTEKRKKENVSINYSISNKSVDIIVRYNFEEDWDVEDARHDLNLLWRNFNLAFIGYKTDCLILKYENDKYKFVTEYFFPMKSFNIDNFHSLEFQKHECKY